MFAKIFVWLAAAAPSQQPLLCEICVSVRLLPEGPQKARALVEPLLPLIGAAFQVVRSM